MSFCCQATCPVLVRRTCKKCLWIHISCFWWDVLSHLQDRESYIENNDKITTLSFWGELAFIFHIVIVQAKLYLSSYGSMENVLDYRNESIITEYMEDFSVERTIAEQHFVELMKFFSVCADKEFDTPYSPSLIVDNVRHIFLEHEEEYKEFCLNFFGKVFGHKVGCSTKQWYNNTRTSLINKFGKISEVVWANGDGANCSTE